MGGRRVLGGDVDGGEAGVGLDAVGLAAVGRAGMVVDWVGSMSGFERLAKRFRVETVYHRWDGSIGRVSIDTGGDSGL